MQTRATKYGSAGHMWPAGHHFDTPDLEEKSQVRNERKGSGVIIDEIHAAIKEIKMKKLQVWTIFQQNCLSCWMEELWKF